jgi:hypothetical protein
MSSIRAPGRVPVGKLAVIKLDFDAGGLCRGTLNLDRADVGRFSAAVIVKDDGISAAA